MIEDAAVCGLIQAIAWEYKPELIPILADRLVEIYPELERGIYNSLVIDKKWPTDVYKQVNSSVNEDNTLYVISSDEGKYPWSISAKYFLGLKKRGYLDTVAMYAKNGAITTHAILEAILDLAGAYNVK